MEKPNDTLAAQVRDILGPDRIAALDKQPLALARGGIEAVLQAACNECAGFPQPHVSAVIRTLQLCGSVPTPADLEGLATPE